MYVCYGVTGVNQGLFNNAAQAWNHGFFWKSLKPQGGGVPPADGPVLEAITQSFGDYATFRKTFLEAANTQFGSGWAWLVKNDTSSTLAVVKTGNAETPLTSDDLVSG